MLFILESLDTEDDHFGHVIQEGDEKDESRTEDFASGHCDCIIYQSLGGVVPVTKLNPT